MAQKTITYCDSCGIEASTSGMVIYHIGARPAICTVPPNDGRWASIHLTSGCGPTGPRFDETSSSSKDADTETIKIDLCRACTKNLVKSLQTIAKRHID